MLRVFKYPENPDQDKFSSGDLAFGLQEGKSLEPLPFYTNGNNSAIIKFEAVEFDQFRKEVGRIDLDTALIDVDSTNNIYNVDGLTEYASGLENGIYRFEFQNDSNLWITEYFNVKDFDTIPAILKDGNTVKWFDYLENVTKDGANLVSSWDNKSGITGIIPGALLQATTLDKGKWFLNDGILFDGISQFMKTLPFTFNQPEQIYMVVNLITWQTNGYMTDGVNDGSGIVGYQNPASPITKAYAGTASDENPNLILNTAQIIRVLFNGANSKFQINETAPVLGDFGSANMGGLTLGKRAIFDQFSNIQVKEIILRKIADTAGGQADIYNYLANKY